MSEALPPVLVFFDGDCVTCHRAVMFLMRRRARQRFRFVSLQLLAGTPWEQAIAQQLGLDLTSSIVAAKDGQLMARSDAVFCLVNELGWPWRLLLVGRIVPRFLRDAVYNAVAKIRYRVFGKAPLASFCEPLPPELRQLVLTEVPKELTPQ